MEEWEAIVRMQLSGLIPSDLPKKPKVLKEVQASEQDIKTPPDPKLNVSGRSKVPVVTIRGTVGRSMFAKGGYKMKIKAGTSQVTLYRMLLAGLVYDTVGMSIEEMMALFELNTRLGLKVSQDPVFNEKYGLWLEATNLFLRKLKVQKYPYVPPQALRAEALVSLKDYLPGQHDYYGWSRNPTRRSQVVVTLSSALPPPRKLPPKRFIGVGYKDSGTRRDPAKDGVGYGDLMKSQVPLKTDSDLRHQEEERHKGVKDRLPTMLHPHKPGPRGRGT